MDSITTHAGGYGSPPAVCIPPEQIELRAVLADDSSLHAIFETGSAQRIVPVDRSDLTSFAAFRQRVQAFLGLRIEFAGDWPDAVAAAFFKGAAI